MSAERTLTSTVRSDGLATTLARGIHELRRPGEGDLPGPALWRLGQIVLAVVVVLTNLIGSAAILGIANFAIPIPSVHDPVHVRVVNGLLAAGYVAVAVPLGTVLGSRSFAPLKDWLAHERSPTPADARVVLYAPMRLFVLQVSLWLIAAVLFGIVNLSFSARLAVVVGIAITITGLVTASCAYLLTERILRPAAARALAETGPERFAVPGVATRAVLAWLLGTGLPVCGVVGIGILALSGDHTTSVRSLALAMVVLGGTGILVGLLVVTLAARTTADPIDSVRRALDEVRGGDFDIRVPAYDGTQIGQLQIGFNQMVSGLAERERIRQTFGTYVDPEVAEHVLEEGTDLAGEQVEVTIMFVDIRDFTGFAEETQADKVVGAINRLFEKVVPVIHEHGGRVDKFVGDGLLAVFGAPRRQEDHADRALAAALEIEQRLGDGDELPVGIGLNSGTVVAGNVGGDGRFEFSVIGDPVNVAARVEAATRDTGDTVLLTESTKELLRGEHPELAERSGIELKGKRETVRVYAPDA